MIMKKIAYSLFLLAGLSISVSSSAQCDSIANKCAARNMDPSFISDGQQYRALLVNADETIPYNILQWHHLPYCCLQRIDRW